MAHGHRPAVAIQVFDGDGTAHETPAWEFSWDPPFEKNGDLWVTLSADYCGAPVGHYAFQLARITLMDDDAVEHIKQMLIDVLISNGQTRRMEARAAQFDWRLHCFLVNKHPPGSW